MFFLFHSSIEFKTSHLTWKLHWCRTRPFRKNFIL